MSFICEHCKNPQPHHQTINFVVTETREKTYENLHQVSEFKEITEVSHGQEIVKQKACCPECYRTLTGLEPRKVLTEQAVSKTNKVHNSVTDSGKKQIWTTSRRGNSGPPNNVKNQGFIQPKKPIVEHVQRPVQKKQ